MAPFIVGGPFGIASLAKSLHDLSLSSTSEMSRAIAKALVDVLLAVAGTLLSRSYRQ